MNRASLSCCATRRTRSSALGASGPALRPGRVLLAVFPSASPLPSTASATGRPVLFGRFVGTTGLSDSPSSCIEGLRPWPSPRGPPKLSGRAIMGPRRVAGGNLTPRPPQIRT